MNKIKLRNKLDIMTNIIKLGYKKLISNLTVADNVKSSIVNKLREIIDCFNKSLENINTRKKRNLQLEQDIRFLKY